MVISLKVEKVKGKERDGETVAVVDNIRKAPLVLDSRANLTERFRPLQTKECVLVRNELPRRVDIPGGNALRDDSYAYLRNVVSESQVSYREPTGGERLLDYRPQSYDLSAKPREIGYDHSPIGPYENNEGAAPSAFVGMTPRTILSA